jgi:hypothetical protein
MKQRKAFFLFVCVTFAILMAGAWVLLPRVETQASSLRAARSQEQDDGRREADGDGLSPNISFIDSPSPTCSLPEPGTNVCYIQWNYLYVTASAGQYIVTTTVALDGHLQAYFSGFFQESMYIPSDMTGDGFRVACGAPGVEGNPEQGYIYDYTIRARETGGLGAANFGTVSCPFDIVPLADVVLTGPTTGIISQTYTFDAAVFPFTTTLPVTYTWTADDQPTTVVVNGLTDAVVYTWTTAGDKVVVVTAQNQNSSVSATLTVAILPSFEVYLPLIHR